MLPSPTPANRLPELPQIRPIGIRQVGHWLVAGLRDTRRAGWLSLAHGLVVAAFGWLLLWFAHDRFWLLAGAFSGFLVVAPVLATSLYAISRALQQGQPVGLQLVVDTWTSWQYSRYVEPGGYWSMVRFGVLLGLAGTGWVLTSAALITLLVPQAILVPRDFIDSVLLAPKGHVFELWVTAGGLLAAPLFASSVITMPLLLDRKLDVFPAVLSSWQAVLMNPVPLAVWAGSILGLTLMGMGLGLVGLIVVVPVLGHASWHAYSDLVDASALPGRVPAQDAR